MSGMQLGFGYAVALVNPIEDYEGMMDYLYNDGDNLMVSYDGTVIYSANRTKQDETAGWWAFPSILEFMDEVQKHSDKFEADFTSLRPVVQHWYNGADDYLSDISAAVLRDKASGA